MIEYFNRNQNSLKINERLSKFTDEQVPIIERHAKPRIEEVNPTTKKEYHPPQGPPSGPTSRRESVNYRKGSFNKKKPEDEEYVAKDDK